MNTRTIFVGLMSSSEGVKRKAGQGGNRTRSNKFFSAFQKHCLVTRDSAVSSKQFKF